MHKDTTLALRCQRHDGIDQIAVVLLESGDGLGPGAGGLGHDELDVLGLDAAVIDGLVGIITGVLDGGDLHIVLEGGSGLGLLHGGLLLEATSLAGLAEDDVGAVLLEDIGSLDGEVSTLAGGLESDAGNAGDGAHAEALHHLPGLLLGAVELLALARLLGTLGGGTLILLLKIRDVVVVGFLELLGLDFSVRHG